MERLHNGQTSKSAIFSEKSSQEVDVSCTYSSSIEDFYENSSVDAMYQIGQIYVPLFCEQNNHLPLVRTLLFLEEQSFDQIMKEDEKSFEGSKFRLQSLMIVRRDLWVEGDISKIPISFFPEQKIFKEDIKRVLDPYYKNITKKSVDTNKTSGVTENLSVDNLKIIESMLASKGELFQEEGADLLIAYLYLRYFLRLRRRALKLHSVL
jgi:hypothetical protein